LSPEVLTQKARDLVTQLGYEKHPVDSAYGMYNNGDMIDNIVKTDKPRPNWEQILSGRPSLMQYWYRQSPRHLVTTDFHDLLMSPGMVQSDDPPQIISGMVNVELDPQGRLIYLQAIPPELESAGSASYAPADWKMLFADSGLDQSQFQTTQPIWNSLAGGDTRVAWSGVWPGSARPLRVEGASWRGKPVFFSLIGDWTKPERSKADDETLGARIRTIFAILLVISIMLAASFFARRNYRQGRGDRTGAIRLAFVMFGLEMTLWICRGHLVAGIETFGMFIVAVSSALFVSGITWLLYLALEPWVRRNWPQSIISWSRLIAGNGRDPLVGRDILFGVILGAVWIVVFSIQAIVLMRMGGPPSLGSTDYLLGTRHALGAVLFQVPSSILTALEFFFVLLGLKVLLRKEWIAASVFVAMFTGMSALGSSHLAVQVPAHIVVYAVAVLIIYRFGLVSMVCAIFTIDMLANVPFTTDFSAWYMSTSIFALLSVVALAGWGFYHSLGGERLFRGEAEA
jgi:hypothetical protein